MSTSVTKVSAAWRSLNPSTFLKLRAPLKKSWLAVSTISELIARATISSIKVKPRLLDAHCFKGGSREVWPCRQDGVRRLPQAMPPRREQYGRYNRRRQAPACPSAPEWNPATAVPTQRLRHPIRCIRCAHYRTEPIAALPHPGRPTRRRLADNRIVRPVAP